jgi:putative phosphotransacetylase
MKTVRMEVILAVGKALGKRLVPAAVSNRHVHLSKEDIDKLFGPGHELTPVRPLSQPGQYAAKETVTLTGPKGSIAGLRVLGPARPETQVEISVTDSFKLGIEPAVRMSGKLEGTPGGTLQAEHGSVEIKNGVVVSARHLHLSGAQARALGLADGQVVMLKSHGEREVIFGGVIVRSGEGHALEVHLDMDEANAAMIKNGDLLEVVDGPVSGGAGKAAAPEPVKQERGKPLITEDDVLAAYNAGQGTLRCARGTLVTPLAADTAREKGVAIAGS